MPNRPEFLAFWLGITSIGGVVALLNTNLAGPALAHSIKVVKPSHIVVAAELLAALRSAQAHIVADAKIWVWEGDPKSVEFCHQVGLNYVSCSPYRVPIARLAAAHAAIKNGSGAKAAKRK